MRKKLIEVALPLDAINRAAAKEKSIRHGHPSTLHLWWARRPLAAARAVVFAQMVDDPSACPDEFPTEADQTRERERLFHLIEEMVQWKNTSNDDVMERARAEIRRSWHRTCEDNSRDALSTELFDPHRLPAFHDPFAGGGALPLEAQRLGLQAHASDLNPVAVLINKAMIEIPPKFAGKPPVNPQSQADMATGVPWPGASALAADVRYYGRWMRDEAERRIGDLYPVASVTPTMASQRPDLAPYEGRDLKVIAWLWARTVRSPNPAFSSVHVPLISNFMLSTKTGREAYVEPVVYGRSYRFEVRVGKPSDPAAARGGTKLGRGANFRCLMSGSPVTGDYIKAEGRAGRLSTRLMAIVAEGNRGRVYLAPTAAHEDHAKSVVPTWSPAGDVPARLTGGTCVPYGLVTWGDLFTARQLVALTTFSDLVTQARDRIRKDALSAGVSDDATPLSAAGVGATAYADAVSVYLAFAQSKACDRNSSLCRWEGRDKLVGTFGRQALPMVWDFAETNPFAGAGGDIFGTTKSVCEVIEKQFKQTVVGISAQANAVNQTTSMGKLISTDPPYYDNVAYADLSDFFYVWLRRSLRSVFPELFSTLVVPKADELIASPYRHGGKESAEAFFLDGMRHSLDNCAQQAHEGFPVTLYYAFKQAEAKRDGVSSTGWETFLTAVINAGFSISGTWPMRTELGNKLLGINANILASSIVLACRRRAADAPLATRREFVATLQAELPSALAALQSGNIAPVDLAQAAIGPGMAVYTRYAKVLDAAGEALTVREALALINQTLDEVLAEQEGDFDADTRWALAWFEQHGFSDGAFGSAETLSKAKNTSVTGMVEAGILTSRGGKVRLLAPPELPSNWDPRTDARLTAWETVHHLVRALQSGETLRPPKSSVHWEPTRTLRANSAIGCTRSAKDKSALRRQWPTTRSFKAGQRLNALLSCS